MKELYNAVAHSGLIWIILAVVGMIGVVPVTLLGLSGMLGWMRRKAGRKTRKP